MKEPGKYPEAAVEEGEIKARTALSGRIFFWLGFTLAGVPAFLYLVSASGTVMLLGAVHRNPLAWLSTLILLGVGLLLVGLWQLIVKAPQRRWQRFIISVPVLLMALSFLAQQYAFPSFRLERITFQNGDVTLSGTLLIPTTGEAPYPAVVILAGCCSNITDESRWGSFATAQMFLQNGIAALVYDKRGFGGSTGNPSESFEELAGDALAGSRQLLAHDDVNPNQVGLLGISQGGWVAPLAASSTDDDAFLILVPGGAVPPTVEYESEIRRALEQANFTNQEIERVWPEISMLRNEINDYYRTGEQHGEVVAALQSVQNERWFRAVNETGIFPGPDEICIYGSRCAESMVANWGFDPLPLVRSLEVPVLYFFGTNDTVMPAGAMIERVKTELPSDSAQNVELVVVHGGGHSMLEAWPIMVPLCYCRPMSPESNGFLDLATGFIPRFVPEYRVRVTSWVLEVVGK